jgi:hypothetical protein
MINTAPFIHVFLSLVVLGMPETEKPVYSEAYERESPALSLRGQIDALTQRRSKDLKNATYLGTTPAQAREFAIRRDRICKLAEHIRLVEGAT